MPPILPTPQPLSPITHPPSPVPYPSSPIPYVELHCHSNFSFLDGTSDPESLIERAAELGLSALALTDSHGLYGIVRFASTAKIHAERGDTVPRAIIGAELLLETGD